jgi:hypothetical protein
MTPRPGNHPEDTPSATGYPAKVSVKASKQQKAAATNAWPAYRELVRASLLAPRADDHHREAA